MADILDGLDEGAEILETKEAGSRGRGCQKKNLVPDAEPLSLKKQKQVESEDDLIGSDHDDSDGSLQDMFMDDEDGSSLSGTDSDDAEDEQLGSEVEDHEESGLELQTNGSEGGSDSEQVDDSDSGSDEEGEDDEAGEVDEAEDSDDDAKDVNLLDGAKSKKENLTERSNRKDGETDIYGRKKVDGVKYIPPHLRGKSNDLSEETIRIQRRLRGLLNRLSEANVESIASDVSLLFQAHGRRMVTELVTDEIIGACCGGPRGNDQFAAVFAAYVAGTATMVGMDFGAKFLASLAIAFEYEKHDSLALRNLALLFANLYSFNLISSELVYDLLGMLCKRFEELDVATILALLQSCGMGLRAADPASMKEFVVAVQQRTAELKATLSGSNNGKPVDLGKRVQFMLDMICDIKNNKRRAKDDPAHHMRLKKWLQKLGVEDVQLRSVTWEKLLEPEKKGQWWLPGPPGGEDNLAGTRAELAGVIDGGAAEADKMLQLAASQRMNTDARRALFCIIMSAEDCVDAFEKILRLKLPGKQDREVVRVIVECCMQERAYNPYYALIVTRLCNHDKNHKFSFQYCLWDHLKQLDSMELRRSTNLARLTAALIGSSSISLSVVKVIDFVDIQKLTPKVLLHFRIMFEYLLGEYSNEVVWKAFSRIASSAELTGLKDGIAIFLHQRFLKQVKSSENSDILVKRCKLAKKALANVQNLPYGSQSREL
uniref:MI domain-containing protein n=1 Tax=Physcomitrium patens TaxID=3218 RepID=A0A7I4D9X4_PHYPA